MRPVRPQSDRTSSALADSLCLMHSLEASAAGQRRLNCIHPISKYLIYITIHEKEYQVRKRIPLLVAYRRGASSTNPRVICHSCKTEALFAVK